jgi:cell division transport system permease protein
MLSFLEFSMFTSIYRVIKFALQNFWRNIWLSVITISMLVLTLLTVNILLVLNRATDQVIAYVENRIEVNVYFNESADQTKVNEALTYLRTLPEVKDVQEISADNALVLFKEKHAQDPAVLSSVDEIGRNPFGPTLVVKARAAKDFDTIISALDNPRFRDEIRQKDFSDYQSIVGKIRQTTTQIRDGGIVLSIIFFIIALLIIFNTVRVAIYIHREEIGIMRLVGASSRFIRAPFLVETILLSLFSVLIVMAIVYPTLALIEPKFSQYFGSGAGGLTSYFEQNGVLIFGAQFIALLFVTMVSTALALRKHLKV